jgi:acyl-CoA synthetase (AMP-forming)/AMP-acid ligase II
MKMWGLAAAVLGADSASVVDEVGRHPMPELRAHAADWAAQLQAQELEPGEPVIVPVSGRAKDVPSMMAVVLAGGVAVPVHRRAHPDSLLHIRNATGARLFLDGLEGSEAIQVEGLPPPSRPLLQDAAFITFTSGSTGLPKGVVLSGKRMLGKLEALTEALDYQIGASAMVPLQLTFSFGQWVTFLTLMHGGAVHLSERFDAATLKNQLIRNGIDYLAAVPTMLRMLPQEPGPGPAVKILSGGEAVLPELRSRLLTLWPASEIYSIYGLTESGTSDLIQHDCGGGLIEDTLGLPSPGVEVKVAPETGELLLRTPYRMLGYLDMPEETAAATKEGWLRTGDVAQIGSDGRVILSGRLKEIINRGGNKVAPLEVERLFSTHPDVETALATGVRDSRLGEAIHLLVVPRTNASVTPETLREWAIGRIDRFKLPDYIHLGKDLPLGRTGKADRAALRRFLETDGST